VDHPKNTSSILTEPALADLPMTLAGTHVRRSFTTSATFSWLVLGFITLIYVSVCFTPVIFDDNEGLYAGAVREMHQRGDWLLPTNNGFPRVQKPPLVYWTMLVSTSIFGGSEFALRLPNALATAGWIIATYLISRRFGGERFGLASAVVLASMLGVWVFTHLIQPEPFLACAVSLSLWCLVEARLFATPDAVTRTANPFRARFEGDRWYLLFWLFLAVGTLSKGLHGALWPLGIALVTAACVPTWRPWLRPILSLRGIVLFLAFVVPWYVDMAMRLPGFLSAHFVNEQLGASLNTRYPPDAQQLSLVQFYGQHFLFWMPWTLILPGSIYAVVRAVQFSRHRPHAFAPQTLDILKLLICWGAVTMLSVAFSTRQDYYSMSCWGVVAAFLTLPWMSGEFAFLRLPRPYLLVPAILFALAGVFAIGFAGWIRPQLATLGEVTAAPISQRDTFYDAIAGISPALWAQFLYLLWIFGAALLATGIASSLLIWQRRFFPALLVFASAMGVTIYLAAAGFTTMSPYFSLAGEASAINGEIVAKPDAIVACEALPHTASSLLYYLNARIHWVNAPFDNQYAQRVLGQGRDYYWDEAGLLAAWHSAHPVYLIVEESRLAHWQNLLPPDARVVNKSGTRLVLCNR
jgi:4-amino-4-deoxy-L-arabinose transferase-like glycosyltransferase